MERTGPPRRVLRSCAASGRFIPHRPTYPPSVIPLSLHRDDYNRDARERRSRARAREERLSRPLSCSPLSHSRIAALIARGVLARIDRNRRRSLTKAEFRPDRTRVRARARGEASRIGGEYCRENKRYRRPFIVLCEDT